jgi:CHAT domain-containing protein
MASPSKLFFICLLILSAIFALDLWLIPSIFGPKLVLPRRFDLDLRQPTTAKLLPYELHSYSVRLRQGDLLHVSVDQDAVFGKAIDVAVTLVGPDGKSLYEVDSPKDAKGAEEVYLLAAHQGRYRVEVAAGQAAGIYRLRPEAIHPASEADRINAEAELLFYRGRTQLNDRNYRDAAANSFQAQNRWLRLKNVRRRADALAQAGRALYEQGQWEQALSVRLTALDLYQSLHDEDEESLLLVAVGAAQVKIGKLNDAESNFQQALAIAARRRNDFREADALGRLAALFEQKGEEYAALDTLERALRTWQNLGVLKEQIRNLESMGRIYSSMGDFTSAMERFREAEAIVSGLDNQILRAECLTRISEVALAAGKPRDALTYARQAVTLSNSANSPSGTDYNSMAMILRQLQQFDQARQAEQQALAIFRSNQDVRGEATALYSLGLILLDTGDLQGAIQGFDQAVNLAETQELLEAKVVGLYGKALAYRKLGNLPKAKELVKQALDAIEKFYKVTSRSGGGSAFQESRLGSYELWISLLVGSDPGATPSADIREAFEASERARRRLLLDSLSSGRYRMEMLKELNPELAEEFNRATSQMLELEMKRKTLELQEEPFGSILESQAAIGQRLRTLEARIGAELEKGTPASLQSTQQALGPDTVLLEYFLGKSTSFLWLVTQSSIEVHTLPGRKDIEDACLKLHSALSDGFGDPEQVTAAAREVSALLLGSVTGRLKAKRIVVVADGAIHYVPFGALPEPEAPAVRNVDADPAVLLASHEIVYEPSISVLQAIRRRRPNFPTARGRIAVIADPDYPKDGYPRLKYSLEEAKAIIGLAPHSSQSALGCQANRDYVLSGKLGDSLYIHFAVHGENHPTQPALSGLALSPRDCEGRQLGDGILRLQDIKDLKLQADLVVLSACKTALGNEIVGEGFEGLTEGFMYAGAARVVVSLWNVDDQSTAELMAHFYKGIFSEKLSPAQALRQAQLWMMKQERWKSPYFWAGFEIQGEWR